MEAYAFIQAARHVCYRYRILQFLPLLASYGIYFRPIVLGSGVFSRWRRLRGLPRLEAAILQRRLLDRLSLATVRKLSRRLIFDIDDAVAYRDGGGGKSSFSRQRLRRFRRTVELADVVIAGNSYLAGLALEAGARQVAVIPTCVDVRRYMAVTRRRVDGGRVRIAWIGSRSTLRYLMPLRPVFEWLARAVPDRWLLRVICDAFPDWHGVPMERIDWSESTEVRALVEADIGIAPLADDRWTRGKCGLKVLQYMAAGLPVVATPVGVQREMVVDGQSGFHARTLREWVDALAHLIAHPSLRQQLGRAGRLRCLRDYDVHTWAEPLARVLLETDHANTRNPQTQAA